LPRGFLRQELQETANLFRSRLVHVQQRAEVLGEIVDDDRGVLGGDHRAAIFHCDDDLLPPVARLPGLYREAWLVTVAAGVHERLSPRTFGKFGFRRCSGRRRTILRVQHRCRPYANGQGQHHETHR
jgi:hypothetical protein